MSEPVEGRLPVEGLAPVEGRVDGWVPVEGRLLPMFEKILANNLKDREYYKQKWWEKTVVKKAESGGIMLGIARLIEAAAINAAAAK